MALSRRALLSGAASLPWAGCARDEAPRFTGGWVGQSHERGHRVREMKSGRLPDPALQRRAGVVIVGAGIAGLAAARALRQAGIDDVKVFDLEDTAGGNSRDHRMAGMACPLGAHYLPLPGDRAEEVVALLEELGLRRTEAGRAMYDERHLCHSPQERLYIGGQWHEGVLPPIDALPTAQRADTLAQYRRFSAEVALIGRGGAFSVPTARAPWSAALQALDGMTFSEWLDERRLAAPALRWYLDYCCRDDFGADTAQVSAWAGLHYFASRHGFHAPGDADGEHDGLLTWPEGNGWLSRRLAMPLGERLHTGRVVLAIDDGRHEVTVDLWDVTQQRVERWTAPQVVLAVPLYIAARLLARPPAALVRATAQMRHAPWLVANLHLGEPLVDSGGAAPSWDNVLYGPEYEPAHDLDHRPDHPAGPGRFSPSSAAPGVPALAASWRGQRHPALGYVDAMHQSTRPHPGPTVLTAYWALGGSSVGQLVRQRALLLSQPWDTWAHAVVADMARAHPDLPAKVRQVDLMRYGHAMSVPVPGVRSSAALASLARPEGRVSFAHSDLSAYSVFEEAMFHGHRVGLRVARAIANVQANANAQAWACTGTPASGQRVSASTPRSLPPQPARRG